MFTNIDLQQFLLGRLTLEAIPYQEPILVGTFAVVALARRGPLGRRHLVRPVGLSLAGMVHHGRSQEDRHHVRDPRHRDAAARLRRCGHDGDPEGALGRRRRRLPAAASLRPDLQRPRLDHDLLHGDAVRHRRDELRHAAADRRARRGLPVPEQSQLLDDGRRRRADHDLALRRRVLAGGLARLPASVGRRLQPGRGGGLLSLGTADRRRRHDAVGGQPDRHDRQDAGARHDHDEDAGLLLDHALQQRDHPHDLPGAHRHARAAGARPLRRT